MPHKLELRARAQRWPCGGHGGVFERGLDRWPPIEPPTPERVSEFLKVVGLSPPETLGAIPTREVVVTADNVANFYHMACVTIQTSDLPTLSPFMVPAYPPAMESRSAHPSPVP